MRQNAWQRLPAQRVPGQRFAGFDLTAGFSQCQIPGYRDGSRAPVPANAGVTESIGQTRFGCGADQRRRWIPQILHRRRAKTGCIRRPDRGNRPSCAADTDQHRRKQRCSVRQTFAAEVSNGLRIQYARTRYRQRHPAPRAHAQE